MSQELVVTVQYRIKMLKQEQYICTLPVTAGPREPATPPRT
jgi:hypothetical protein